VIYCRTAHPDRIALEAQKKQLLAYAAAQRFTVVGVISESGSGLDYSRKGLREAVALAEDDDVDILLMKSLCLLGRSTEKTDALLRRLKENGVRMVCADGIEPETSLEIFSRLLLYVRSSR